MSRSFAVYYADNGQCVPLPEDAPSQFRSSYGQADIMNFWNEFQELSTRLGIAPIHEFICMDIIEEYWWIHEQHEEAEEDGDDEAAQDLMDKMHSLMPGFKPEQIRRNFKHLRKYIQAHRAEIRSWEGGEIYTDLARFLIDELTSNELALKEAESAGRSVFVHAC